MTADSRLDPKHGLPALASRHGEPPRHRWIAAKLSGQYRKIQRFHRDGYPSGLTPFTALNWMLTR